MGVSLALKRLENALRDNDQKCICTLGPIIHNPQVLAHFESLGVKCLDKVAEAGLDDCVLIRAHGIPRDEEQALRQVCARVVDATCPKVKSAQLAIGQATENGASLLLFGETVHPEVRGLVSYASAQAFVFSSPEELEAIDIDPTHPWVLASQTTQDRETFEKIANKLEKAVPGLTILSTICDATRQRQEEALRIAAQVDAMVVAGGKQSGNTRRLASLAANAGIAAFHVENAAELDAASFAGKKTVGLTAGASTPRAIIDEIEQWLHNIC